MSDSFAASGSWHCPARRTSLSLPRFLLIVMALSLPWDLFQRIPYSELTLTKAAGGVLILLWFLDAMRLRRRLITWHPLWAVGLALVAFGLVTTAWSHDRAATLSRTHMYFSYVLLAGAIVYWTTDRMMAQEVGLAFVASSALVGFASILCRLGLLIPTYVVTTARLGGRVTPDAWQMMTSRMVCASDDFNLGVFPLLLSAVWILHRLIHLRQARERVFALSLFFLLVAGIAISLSRSSVLILVGACLVLALSGVRRAGTPVAALSIGACVTAVVLGAFLVGPQGLVDRMKAGLGERDASYEGRMAAFQAALELLPRYGLLGTGLDASDRVIAGSPYGARVNGVTVHSVPLKLFLEMGVVGLALYLTGWLALLRLLWKHRRDVHGGSCVAMALTVFGVLLIQPFMALSLFPFLAGIALGPLMSPRLETNERKCGGYSPPSTMFAVLLTVPVVAVNLASYQSTAHSTYRYVEAMADALEAERSGQWEASRDAYGAAGDLAGAADLGKRRYYAIAAEVFDLDYLQNSMHVSGLYESPQSLAIVGLARVAYAQGQWSLASKLYSEVLETAHGNAGIRWEHAETLWMEGRFQQALDEYLACAGVQTDPNQEAHAKRMSLMDERIGVLRRQAGREEAQLEMAALLRKRGRWDDALTLYQSVAEKGPTSPEALYHLAIQKELEGHFQEAQRIYRLILTHYPNHVGTATRIEQLKADP